MGTSGNIRRFFEPKSVAVAGVSVDPGKMASIIFANLRENAAKGLLKASVYPVNPAHRRVGGVRCYPSVRSLPEVPDLLIIAVPVSLTLPVVKEAAEAGVKAAVVVTSGFAEAGRKDLEMELARTASDSGMRILGPNTIGLLDTRSGVDSLFLPRTKPLPGGRNVASLIRPRKGSVAIITQSGHLGETISEELAANGVGLRAIVGTGNQADVSVEDLIGYFADDDHTKVIALYLEGVLDGRRFMRESARAANRKPVVVLKVGKTSVGAKAALTHTASMAGDYEAYQAAFRQSGLIEVPDIEGLVDACIAFSLLPPVSGKSLAILTNAGGVGAIAADEAQRLGLDVVP
ncbi:MAG TPA: CoA-binding protein, partial [Nitrososphaerales archaeon]|nr:CoA-binding protein [Nitrososphaerales archaeon]